MNIRILILLFFLCVPKLCFGIKCSDKEMPCTKTIKFGLSFPLPPEMYDPERSELYPFYFTKWGLDVFLEWAKDKAFCVVKDDVEERFCFGEPVYLYDFGNTDTTIENYETLIEEEDEYTYLLTTLEVFSQAAQVVTESNGRLLLATYATNPSFYEEAKRSFSMVPPFHVGINSAIPVYRLAGAKTATFLTPDFDLATPDYLPRIKDICKDVDKQLKRSYFDLNGTVYFHPDRNAEDAPKSYREAAQKLKEIDSDLVIYCGVSGTVLQFLLEEMKKIDYTPKGLISGGTREYAFDRNIANYITHISLVTAPPEGFPPAKYIKSTNEYLEIFKKLYPDFVTDDPVFMYGYTSVFAGEILLNAIEITNSFDENDLIHAIRTELYQSFLGEFGFSSKNGNLNDGIAVQLAGEKDNIFAPAILSNASLIYPMPKWEERIESSKYHASEIVIMVVLAICLINSILWCVYVFINRKRKRILASSPIFLMSMLIGSIIIYIGLYLWMPKHISTETCILRVAFLLCGFMLLFGSLIVKTWRVHLIFSQNSLEVFKISNKKVALFLSLLLSVDVILFIVWVSVSSPKSELQIVDEYRPSLNYYKCSSSRAGEGIIWAMVGYHSLLFLYGGYLALRVRTIPIKIYDESKIIAFCIYNIGFIAIVVCILEGTKASSDRYVQFLVRSILIIISTALTINAMFFAKAKVMNTKTQSSATATNSAEMSHSNIRSYHASNVELSDTIEKLKKDKKKLKKEIKQLKEALSALQNEGEDPKSNSDSS